MSSPSVSVVSLYIRLYSSGTRSFQIAAHLIPHIAYVNHIPHYDFSSCTVGAFKISKRVKVPILNMNKGMDFDLVCYLYYDGTRCKYFIHYSIKLK